MPSHPHTGAKLAVQAPSWILVQVPVASARPHMATGVKLQYSSGAQVSPARAPHVFPGPPAHSPVLATDTPALAAAQSLPYVLSSQPHTGE